MTAAARRRAIRLRNHAWLIVVGFGAACLLLALICGPGRF